MQHSTVIPLLPVLIAQRSYQNITAHFPSLLHVSHRPLIKKYTGVDNYKGRADQIQKVMEHVTVKNYKDMSRRVKKLETIDTITGGSNFGRFIELFEGGDVGWIYEINNRIEV